MHSLQPAIIVSPHLQRNDDEEDEEEDEDEDDDDDDDGGGDHAAHEDSDSFVFDEAVNRHGNESKDNDNIEEEDNGYHNADDLTYIISLLMAIQVILMLPCFKP